MRRTSLLCALTALTACSTGGASDAASAADGGDGNEATDGTQDSGDGAADQGESESESGESEESGETGDPDCIETECGKSSEEYCFPCDPDPASDEPFLTLEGQSGFEDGGTMSIVCGGQGSWMFEIRPGFGGFTLDEATVRVDYDVKVEDFNLIGESFAKGGRDIPVLCCDVAGAPYQGGGIYDCNEEYGGLCYGYQAPLDVIRFFPPDVPDLMAIDGQVVELTATLDAGDHGAQEFIFTGFVEAAGNWEDCDYYNDSPEPDPHDWHTGGPIPN